MRKESIIKAKTTIGLAMLLIAPLFLSCEDDTAEPVICTTEFVYGLEIILVDSVTGGPTGLGAWATVTDGDYEEVILCEDRGPLGVAAIGAGERPGTYDILIEADG